MRKRNQEEIAAIKEGQEITHITKDCGMSAVEGVKEIANLMEDDINELFKDDIINNYVKWLVENVGKWVVISRLDAPFENETLLKSSTSNLSIISFKLFTIYCFTY